MSGPTHSTRDDPRALWAAIMLALDVWTCESVIAGRRVRAGNLDALVLRRALRGQPFPDCEDFTYVSADMLAAVAEAGPLVSRGKEAP
jgi:hypothetical protein